MSAMPSLHDVFSAARRIAGTVRETELISSAAAGGAGPAELLLKLESLQNTGAFKVRGAANKILGLSPEEQERGVITFSTGNHGKAVSYVAGSSGIRAVVCLSEHVPEYRARKIRELGAEVEVYGRSQDEAEDRYNELVAEKGYIPVVPFDDPAIIAGQGTIALEMLARRPDIEVLLVPLSGGGLLAGIAMAAKAIKPDIRVVGISIERSPAMLESIKAGRPVQVEEKDTLADSLLGGIGMENRYTLPLVREHTDEHVTVGEEEIAEAMAYLFTEHSLVAEGAASVGIAALRSGKVDVRGKVTAAVVSGSSVDPAEYLRTVGAHIGD
jgi:threonine dehydratase